MLTAFLLGLVGSVTHCVGMCSGVMLLLGRGRAATGRRRLVLHAGRLTTYAGLGAVAGALGYGIGAAAGMHHHGGAHDAAGASVLPGAAIWSGALALLAATTAVYMALALLGRVPSPELLLVQFTRWWGRVARGLYQGHFTCQALPKYLAREGLQTYLLGLFWGLLPCGLVLAALLMAAATGSPVRAATTVLAFGLGTMPLGLGMGWAGSRLRPGPRRADRLRPVAAALVLLFGAQMALRGLAAWGWVAHGRLGALSLW
ncbi:MAG: sulfite exporter TauE/SafE family protein [Anaerolineae bacterium]